MDLLYKLWRRCRLAVVESGWRVSTVAEGGNLGFEGNEMLGISVA